MGKVVIFQKRNGMYVLFNERGERIATPYIHLAKRYEAGDEARVAVAQLNANGHEFSAVIVDNPPYYSERGGWHLTCLSEARALAEALGIKNVSRFINQVPHMRALADAGKLEELNEYVLSIKNSRVAIGYPNSHTYYNG